MNINKYPTRRKFIKSCHKTTVKHCTNDDMDNSSGYKFLGIVNTNSTGYQYLVEIDGQQHNINYTNDAYPRDSPNYAGWYNEQHIVEIKDQKYVVNSTPQHDETYEGPSPIIKPPVVEASLSLKEVPCSNYCGQYVPWNTGRCNKCR